MTKGRGKNPGAGGLSKHISRRPHKERLQPEDRRHLGHLEKHRDYVNRAKLFHMKEDKIKELEKQVSERNPEEFYFEMIHASADQRSGKHITQTDTKRSSQQQIAMNAKDIQYLEFRRNLLRRELAKNTVMPCNSSGMHTTFQYSSDEECKAEAHNSDNTKYLDEHYGEDGDNNTQAKETAKKKQLFTRIDRVLQALKHQTNLIKKGGRKKVVLSNGVEAYKWFPKRRRN